MISACTGLLLSNRKKKGNNRCREKCIYIRSKKGKRKPREEDRKRLKASRRRA
jgi:hypothetical protein